MRNVLPIAIVLLAGCADDPVTTKDDSVTTNSDEIVIVDSEFLEYKWVRKGDSYVRDDKQVPASIVAHLRRLAQAAPTQLTELPEELNVTPETAQEHEGDILDAALGFDETVPHDVPPELEHLFAFEAIRKAALETLIGDDATDSSGFSIALPGEPPMTLQSHSESAWMQPWEVTIGDETKTTKKVFSLEISKAVALLADPRGYGAQYLHGARYWRNGFWRDADVWSDRIGKKLVEHHAHVLCEELDGYDAMRKRFRIEDADIGHINQQPLSLQVDLRATRGQFIDRVRWWNVYEDGEDGEPGCDWEGFERIYDACTKAAGKLPFLRAWKAGDKQRWISFDAVGATKGYGETNMRNFVLPPWKHSGLKGDPEFELHLCTDRHSWAEIYFSSDPDGALLVHAAKAFPKAKGVNFHPTEPEYAIIRPDGRIERKSLPAR